MELNHLASEYTNAERRPQSISLREYRLLHPYSTAEKSQCAQSSVPVLMRKERRCEQVQRNPRLNFLRSQKRGVVAPRALSRNVRSISSDGRNGRKRRQSTMFPVSRAIAQRIFPLVVAPPAPSLGAPFIQTPSLHAPGSVKELRGSGEV